MLVQKYNTSGRSSTVQVSPLAGFAYVINASISAYERLHSQRVRDTYVRTPSHHLSPRSCCHQDLYCIVAGNESPWFSHPIPLLFTPLLAPPPPAPRATRAHCQLHLLERFAAGVEQQREAAAAAAGGEELNTREVNVLASLRDLFALSIVEEVGATFAAAASFSAFRGFAFPMMPHPVFLFSARPFATRPY